MLPIAAVLILNQDAGVVSRRNDARAQHFLAPPRIEIPFQAADAIDEEFTVDVIDLVLQGNGEKAVGFDLYFFFVFVEGGHLDPYRPAHFRGKIDDA